MVVIFATVGQTLSQFGGIVGLASLLIIGFVYLYSTAKKGRQDVVRQDNIDLRASNQELRTEKAGYIATITQQTDTIKNLREVATQTPAVTKLLELTSKQQQITNKQHSDVIHQLADLASEISKMTTEFSKVATAMTRNTSAQDANRRERKS